MILDRELAENKTLKCRTPNEQFGKMAAVAPQKVQCEHERK